jgi:hypothetical protein
MEIVKTFRQGDDTHMIVTNDGERFQNWYSVQDDRFTHPVPSSIAEPFYSLEEAEAAMRKHRPLAREV